MEENAKYEINKEVDTDACKVLIDTIVTEILGYKKTKANDALGIDINKINALKGQHKNSKRYITKNDFSILKNKITEHLKEKMSDEKNIMSPNDIWNKITEAFKNGEFRKKAVILKIIEKDVQNKDDLEDAMAYMYKAIFGSVCPDPLKIERLAKGINILIQTDEDAINSIRALKDENKWVLNIYEDDQAGVDNYDILYIIVDNSLSRKMREELDFIMQNNKNEDLICRGYFSIGSSNKNDEKWLSEFCDKNNIKLKKYYDKEVYLFDIYKDIEKIHRTHQMNMSERLNSRKCVIEELHKKNENEKLIDTIRDDGWSDIIKKSDDEMRFAQIAYEEYSYERYLLYSIIKQPEGNNSIDNILINALRANVSPKVLECIIKDLKKEKKIENALDCTNVIGDDMDNRIRSLCKIYNQLFDALMKEKRLEVARTIQCRSYHLSKALFEKEQKTNDKDYKLYCVAIIKYVRVLWELNRYLQAWDLLTDKFVEIKKLYEKCPEIYKTMRKAYQINGSLLHHQGRLQDARKSYEKAQKVLEDHYGSLDALLKSLEKGAEKDKNLYSYTCNGLAFVYADLGDYDNAKKYYDFKKIINEENDDHYHLSIYFNNIAQLMVKTTDDLKSNIDKQRKIEQHFTNSILEKEMESDNKKKTPKMYKSKQSCYTDYADFYREIGRFGEALDKIETAEKYYRKIGSDEENSFSTNRADMELTRGRIMLEASLAGDADVDSENCEQYLINAYETYKQKRDANHREIGDVTEVSFFDEQLLKASYALTLFYSKVEKKEKNHVNINKYKKEATKCINYLQSKDARYKSKYREWGKELEDLTNRQEKSSEHGKKDRSFDEC